MISKQKMLSFNLNLQKTDGSTCSSLKQHNGITKTLGSKTNEGKLCSEIKCFHFNESIRKPDPGQFSLHVADPRSNQPSKQLYKASMGSLAKPVKKISQIGNWTLRKSDRKQTVGLRFSFHLSFYSTPIKT